MSDKIQHVIIKFDDGTEAVFSGKAICEEGDTRRIVDIKFTVPTTLPEDLAWEKVG